MARPPRAAGESPFATRRLGRAVVQGLGVAAMLLLGFGLLLGHGTEPAQARGAVFAALLGGLFLLILANRHPTRAVLARPARRNPWTGRMGGALILALAAAFGLPFLRRVMDIALPGPAAAAAMLAMLGGILVWLELLRRMPASPTLHRPASPR